MDISTKDAKRRISLLFLLPLSSQQGLAPPGILAPSSVSPPLPYRFPAAFPPFPEFPARTHSRLLPASPAALQPLTDSNDRTKRNDARMSRVQVYTSSIHSTNAIRSQHERVARYLAAGKVEHTNYDIASDPAAKSVWQRKNKGNTQLPFILVDGEPVGSIEEFDDAVEHGETHLFLRLNPSPALPPLPKFTPPASPSFSHAPLPATPTTADSSFNEPSHEGTPRRASVADFASLDLSPEELAELVREIEAGETFDSAVVPSSPVLGSGNVSPLPSVEEENPIIETVRAGPERSISQDAPYDEFDGIDITEAESEQILRELDGGMDDISLESPLLSRPSQFEAERSETSVEKQEEEGGMVEQIVSPKPLTADAFTFDRRSLEAERDGMMEVDIGGVVAESGVQGKEVENSNESKEIKLETSAIEDSSAEEVDREAATSPFDLIPDSPNLAQFSSSSTSAHPSVSTPQSTTPAPTTIATTNELAAVTSIENGDGAALSAPASEVAALHLSSDDVAELESTPIEGVLEVESLEEEDKDEFVDTVDSTSPPVEEEPDEPLEKDDEESAAPPTKLSKKAAKRANQKAKRVASEQQAVEELKADLNNGALEGDEKEVPNLEAVSF